MKRHTGFTLIEVLIALCIIAIALTAALRATVESTRATTHVKNTMIAHWVAMNVLSEVQTGLVSVSESDGTAHGKSAMLGLSYAWSAKADPVPNSPALKLITVEVRFNDHLVNTVSGYEAVS